MVLYHDEVLQVQMQRYNAKRGVVDMLDQM